MVCVTTDHFFSKNLKFASLLHANSYYLCYVKIVTLVFAAFLFYLAVYPCSDRDTCVDEVRFGLALSENDNHSHTTNEEDFCTPFCICSCCAAQIQLNLTDDITFTNPIHNTRVNTLYRQSTTLNNSDSIWQPPKIA